MVSRPFASLAARKAKAPRAKPAAEPPPELGFEAHMHGVAPLARKAQRIPATASAIEAVPRDAKASASDHEEARLSDLARLVSEGIRFELIDDGALLEGRRIDVDPRELRRLRRLKYAVDGKLDLHGHDAASAKLAVERYVERRRSQGDRAILIVHGKGLHSPRGTPILRAELGAWLSQGRAAKDVLAFASIEDQDGASGALFVLLARRQP